MGCCLPFLILASNRSHLPCRVINVVAIAATTYTAWYIVISAAQHGVTPGAALRWTCAHLSRHQPSC